MNSSDKDLLKKTMLSVRRQISSLERILIEYGPEIDSRARLISCLDALYRADGALSMYLVETN